MIITLQDLFQHTATRRWLPVPHPIFCYWSLVSTHSHPKVAADIFKNGLKTHPSFNTQPPEGGCFRNGQLRATAAGFNTQPPEGGCLPNMKKPLNC